MPPKPGTTERISKGIAEATLHAEQLLARVYALKLYQARPLNVHLRFYSDSCYGIVLEI